MARLGHGIIGLAAIAAVGTFAFLAPQQSAGVASAGGTFPRYYGVNLPSGTFGKKPGVYGKDYVYPTAAVAEPFRTMGMNAVRVGFLWGRLQHQPYATLDPVELGRIDRAVNDMGGFQLIVLDLHNYARYKKKRLDDPSMGGAVLADLWAKLAEHYKNNPKVAFGIMNEPHGIDADVWRDMAEQTLSAIRRTGARNLVLIPGTNWSGAHSWMGSNAAAMSGFRDSGGNFMFELHQYFDSDSSGTKPDCVDATVGRRRLAGVTRWLREQHARGFLAEFGTPPTPTCLKALDDALDFIDENGDAWGGWTYWAAGARWHNYPFDIQPDGDGPKPQAQVLAGHIRLYRN